MRMLVSGSGRRLKRASAIPHSAAPSISSRMILGHRSGPARPSRVEMANDSATVQSQMAAQNTTRNGPTRRARSRMAIKLVPRQQAGRGARLHDLLPDRFQNLDLLGDIGPGRVADDQALRIGPRLV